MQERVHIRRSLALAPMPQAASAWSRWIAWAKSLEQTQDMSFEWTCCGTPMLDRAQVDLGRVAKYDLVLHACAHCGMRWMHVSSNAADVKPTRWVPVAQQHLGMLLVARPGIEQTSALQAWVDKHVVP
jgi:hypothetical protein